MERLSDCSCPRGGGWRPGARWAGADAQREQVQAEIERMPVHQRPPMRELGRRSEAADPPFRRLAPAPAALPEVPELNVEAPMVTAHRAGQRMTVAAACPSARALGLHAGMPLTQARALVPGLDVRDADPAADAALLERLALLAARRWSPRVAPSGTDGLWIDLTGVAHLFGDEGAMCARIIALCRRAGIDARIAVAGTTGAAHALARHGGGEVLILGSGEEVAAIAPLPPAALRLTEAALAAARRLGIERIDQLLAMPRGPLARRLGHDTLLRIDQATGRAAEPFDPIVPEDPPVAAVRLPEPIATAEGIGVILERLMAQLVETLERAGLAARAIELCCTRLDRDEQRIGIGTARATRDGGHLLRLLSARIERIEPGFGIEAMRLTATRCEPLGAQAIPGTLAGEQPPPDLVPLIDRLAERLGSRRLYRMSALESDVPERSVARLGPLDPPAAWPEWPRPARLLHPAERAENVVALLPDQPPRRFNWRGRPHVVRQADGPERIFGEWWRRGGEASAVRDYFQVEDEGGARFWIYRRGDGVDPRTGDLSWWVQGLFG